MDCRGPSANKRRFQPGHAVSVRPDVQQEREDEGRHTLECEEYPECEIVFTFRGRVDMAKQAEIVVVLCRLSCSATAVKNRGQGCGGVVNRGQWAGIR